MGDRRRSRRLTAGLVVTGLAFGTAAYAAGFAGTHEQITAKSCSSTVGIDGSGGTAGLTEATAAEIAALPGVVGLKDGTGDLERMHRIVRAIRALPGGQDLAFFNGLPTAERNSADDVIVPGAIEVRDGAVKVPTGPGLGVELDPDTRARAHRRYLDSGIRNRDDTGYMRRIRPEYERRLPRW